MTTVIKSLAKISFAATHSKVNLPELPEEIWAEILRIACGVSELADTPKLMSFPSTLPKRVLRRRMKDQRRIIQVCKTWYRLALSCLYEEIAIMDRNGFQKLAEIFERMAQASLGMHTKRLDVCPVEEITESDMEVLTALLLPQMPNIRVLILQLLLPDNIHNSFVGQLLALPNLRVLYTPSNLAYGRFGNDALISSYTNTTLRTVRFPFFPSFRSIDDIWSPALPHLSQIYLPYSVSEGRLIRYVTKTPGGLQSVTSLLIGQYSWTRSDVLTAFCSLLPRLEYVGLQTTFGEFGLKEEPLPAFPGTVHTLGITFQKPQAKYKAYGKIRDKLSSIKAEGLKTIQLQERTVADIRSRRSVSTMMEDLFRTKGWVMEAGDMYV